MSLFGKKDQNQEPNLYWLINKEMERLYGLISDTSQTKGNVQAAWRELEEIRDQLKESLKKAPTSEEQIKDLQSTVTELLLHTNTDSKN
jgi:hypothetical protein